ncbi:hypothetical protein QBC39DRAFT_351269 [Podospora conica]|nr:hypothetical protein QBC39DRAFT_351269 [Schizothecium conicum]
MPLITPPYSGPPPPGLKEEDVDFWNAFVLLDNQIGNPADTGGFLFYSGDNNIDEHVEKMQDYIKIHNGVQVTPWQDVFGLDLYWPEGSSDPRAIWKELIAFRNNEVDISPEETTPLHFKCMAWSIARRAAKHGYTVHLMLWKGDPLLSWDSCWAQYEAGIVTGRGSKVRQIVRWDVESIPGDEFARRKTLELNEFHPGTPSPSRPEKVWNAPRRTTRNSSQPDAPYIRLRPGVVVWERKHDVLGVPFEKQDWVRGPVGNYTREDAVWYPKLKGMEAYKPDSPPPSVKVNRVAAFFHGVVKWVKGARHSKSK